MKNILFILCALFVSVTTYAQTETINWYKDGELYDTTTCESGGDITVPSENPVKYGYTFQGWEEFFYRGQYPNFKNVPTNLSYYLTDYHNNNTPKNNDYIILDDASDYIGDIVEIKWTKVYQALYCDLTFKHFYEINGVETIRKVGFSLQNEYSVPTRTVNDPVDFNGRTLFYVIGENSAVYIMPVEPLVINGTKVLAGAKTLLFSGYYGAKSGTILFSKSGDFLSGAWQFSYHGIWEENGTDGWKPAKKL